LGRFDRAAFSRLSRRCGYRLSLPPIATRLSRPPYRRATCALSISNPDEGGGGGGGSPSVAGVQLSPASIGWQRDQDMLPYGLARHLRPSGACSTVRSFRWSYPGDPIVPFDATPAGLLLVIFARDQRVSISWPPLRATPSGFGGLLVDWRHPKPATLPLQGTSTLLHSPRSPPLATANGSPPGRWGVEVVNLWSPERQSAFSLFSLFSSLGRAVGQWLAISRGQQQQQGCCFAGWDRAVYIDRISTTCPSVADRPWRRGGTGGGEIRAGRVFVTNCALAPCWFVFCPCAVVGPNFGRWSHQFNRCCSNHRRRLDKLRPCPPAWCWHYRRLNLVVGVSGTARSSHPRPDEALGMRAALRSRSLFTLTKV
jgi:hypothetical protein